MIKSVKNVALLLPLLFLASGPDGVASDTSPLHGQVKIQSKPQSQLTTSTFEEKWSSDDITALDEDVPSSTPSFLTQTFPRLEVRTNKDYVKVVAELPGVPQGNIELLANSDVLCIAGKRQPAAGDKVIVSELPAGSFKRRVRLPYPVLVDQADASLKDGILTVTMPRWQSAETPKRISVSTKEVSVICATQNCK